MTHTIDAELLYLPQSESLRFLPEGPTALGTGRFSWVAIQHGPNGLNGSLNLFDLDSRTNLNFPLPGRPGFAKPTSDPDKFVVGYEHSLGIFSIAEGTWQELTNQIDTGIEGTIVNDGTLYANNVLFGTKDLEFKTPKAGLYVYRGSDGKLFRLADNQICSNGKDVVDAGSGKLYLIDIDSATRKVVRYRFDLESPGISDVETILDFADLPGVPDGMTLTPDSQSIIISFYNPNAAEFGETRQYSLLNGELETIWRTPHSPQNTCPLLIETSDGSVKLIITTAVEFMPAERRADAKLAGGLFMADTPFATSPPSPVLPLDKLAGWSAA